MSQPILRTKVIPPRRRSDLLERPRLLDLLQQQLERSLLLVIAPAGYGKTSLLIDLVQHMDQPVCWYSADSLDRNLYRFLAHFLAALSHTFPQFGPESNAALQSLIAGQSGYEQFMSILLNEVYERIPEPFVLVVDDYHTVSEQEEIDAFVSQFVQQVDQHCHLFLASRRLLSLPDLPLMVARGQVGGVGIEELAFRSEEIQSLLRQNFAVELNEADATAMVESTEGWITGLMLSTQLMQPGMTQQSSLVRSAGVSLYDYLAQQVLAKQSPAVIDFLLRTSPLGEFNPTLAATLLDPLFPEMQGRWSHLFNTLVEQNLFILHLGEEDGWVRYHALFQEFLRQTLSSTRRHEEEAILHRMADYFTENEEWEKAFQALHSLGEPVATARFLERAGAELIHQDKIRLLEDWLEAVPLYLMEQRPQLILLRGCLETLNGNWDVGLQSYTRALTVLGVESSGVESRDGEPGERESREGESTDVALANALMHRSIAHRFLGRYPAAIKDATQSVSVLDQLEQQNTSRHPEHATVDNRAAEHRAALRGTSYKSLGLSLYMSGQAAEGKVWLEKALSVYESIADVQKGAVVAVDIATMHMNAGEYTKAERQFRRGLEVWRSLHHVTHQARVLNNLGVVCHLQGKFEEAQQALEESVTLAQKSQQLNLLAFAQTSLGDLHADRDQVSQASALYAQAHTVARQIEQHFLLLYLELAEANLDCTVADWASAYSHLDRAGRLVVEEVSDYEWGLYQLSMGRFYLAQHQNDRALNPLQDAVRRFRAGNLHVELTQTYLLLAVAYHRLSVADEAHSYLQCLINRTASMESWQPFISLARHFSADWAEIAAETETLPPEEEVLLQQNFLRALLPHVAQPSASATPTGNGIQPADHASTLAVSPPVSPISTAPPTPPVGSTELVIRALGQVEVTFQGQLVGSSEWQAQSARDLFLCLIAHPEGLTKDEIGELFWPESSPNQLKTRFKNAIYRLRKALHPDAVLFQKSRYRFNYASDHSYDVNVFLESIQQARTVTAIDARKAWYHQAIAAYGGEYLPDVDAPWIWAERERLNRLFVEGYLELGELHLSTGEFADARRCAEGVLAHDPCLEEAHRLLMNIHAAMGNRAEIARQFQECERALHEEIDAPPSPQTIDLYQRLMR